MVGRPRSIKKESFSTKSIDWQRDSVFCNLSFINRISLRLVIMEVAVCGVLCKISMMQLLVMPIYKTLKSTVFIPQPIFSSWICASCSYVNFVRSSALGLQKSLQRDTTLFMTWINPTFTCKMINWYLTTWNKYKCPAANGSETSKRYTRHEHGVGYGISHIKTLHS